MQIKGGAPACGYAIIARAADKMRVAIVADIHGNRRAFQAVLAANADNKAAVLLLGDALLQTGRFQQVVDLLSPRDAQFSNDMGFAYVLGTAPSRRRYGRKTSPNDGCPIPL